jgi:hypothetical protein
MDFRVSCSIRLLTTSETYANFTGDFPGFSLRSAHLFAMIEKRNSRGKGLTHLSVLRLVLVVANEMEGLYSGGRPWILGWLLR